MFNPLAGRGFRFPLFGKSSPGPVSRTSVNHCVPADRAPQDPLSFEPLNKGKQVKKRSADQNRTTAQVSRSSEVVPLTCTSRPTHPDDGLSPAGDGNCDWIFNPGIEATRQPLDVAGVIVNDAPAQCSHCHPTSRKLAK